MPGWVRGKRKVYQRFCLALKVAQSSKRVRIGLVLRGFRAI